MCNINLATTCPTCHLKRADFDSHFGLLCFVLDDMGQRLDLTDPLDSPLFMDIAESLGRIIRDQKARKPDDAF